MTPPNPAKIGLPNLLPDSVILVEARVKAGSKSFNVNEISNLIGHDPVVSMELFQYANSAVFGGTPVIDIEGAITRLGAKRLIEKLSELNRNTDSIAEDIWNIFEVLRYNSRRTSIVSMIVAGVIRPTIMPVVRMSGLFSEVGHMAALMKLGEKYCELVRKGPRKLLPYRLSKDHNIDVAALALKFLRAKGIPEKLIVPYDMTRDIKIASDADIRFCVQGALEIIQAFDSGKPFTPDQQIPANSVLRLLNISANSFEKICKASGFYLKRVSENEAPEGASMLLADFDEVEVPRAEETAVIPMPLPTYPNSSVNAKSRECLKGFFELCEKEESSANLGTNALRYLKQSGLFERLGLIFIPDNSKTALIFHSIGLEKQDGESISITDPLSPFNLFTLGIKSCSTKVPDSSAPFGKSAYAIGPVDLTPSGDRVLMYIDQNGASLTMENRRVFRLAIGLLTSSFEKLRGGGAPVAN